jgi:hypothetical protein
MVICEKCNKDFKTKYILIKHLNKKIPCDNVIKCENCLKEFKTNQHLQRHINRKNKCIKVDLERENLELKNEILELKLDMSEKNKQSITNNITNNINNNTQVNIFTPEGKLYHTYFLKSNPLEQLEFNIDNLSNLTLEDYTDELSNIYNFTNLIKEICFNMKLPKNWIICKDDLFNELKLKIDNNNNIVNCVDNILHLIYSIAIQVINYEELDNELIEFYKTFIKKYEREEYKDNKNVEQFIKLCNEELFKHFSKILNIINDRKNNIKKIEIKINNFGEEDITFIKRTILTNELLNIIEKKYSSEFYSNKFKIDNYNYTGVIDLKMIDIFTYFLNLLYTNESYLSNNTIKYNEDKYYIYINNTWVKIEIKELINQIFSKIHIILKINKINLELNMHTEDYIEESYTEKYNKHYQIGDSKYYKKIIKQYYINNKSFDNHNLNII